MSCLACARGFCEECEDCEKSEGNPCHIVKTSTVKKTLTGQIGRPVADPETHKDPLSTGRKRAAHLYPIFKEEPCEWRGKKNCGGGKHPIIGCRNGFQRHRHHGPIKDPRHNEPGNVHRVCHHCHRRWHTMNDKDYDAKFNSKNPHKPEEATEEELIINEGYWELNKPKVNVGEED